jgi:transposase
LIPGHIALDKVDFWFQDEARLGQQNTTTRLWSKKGSCPRALKQQHLELISKRTQPGRHAVIIMDGAGWHTEDIAQAIENLSIIKLPPYSPELNPAEQVWSLLRQHHLANRCVNGYDDIVDACSKAWNSFIDDTKRITQMSSRDWLDVGKT